MTHLEQLLQDLCPNGVKWVSVNTLVKDKLINIISASIKIKRNEYLSEGATPIVSQEEEYISGYTNMTDDKIQKDEYVCFGDHSEHFKYIDFAFVQGADGLKILKTNQGVLITKYFYYACCNFYKKHCNYERHYKYLAELQIPLPPLAVQSEIVRILDKFTLYKSELAAELAARCKQYEFYRNQLLNFDKILKRVKLGEIAEISRGVRVVKKDLAIDGDIPVYQNSMQPLGYYDQINTKANTTFVISAGAAGEIGFSKVAYWAADDCLRIIGNEHINDKFIYYWLLNNQKNISAKVRRASIPRLSKDVIINHPIPLPSLAEQERIVAILDRFDTLCHDIREGLPAEIDLRQKQYEYYRDKLLTFERI